MRKNRKYIAAGIIALVAVIGICVYAYAEIRDESEFSRTVNISTESESTSGQLQDESGISAKAASETAVSSAVSKYGIQESTVRDLEAEREYEGGELVWEVTFDAADQNGHSCEFEYRVSCEDGTVTHHHMECEDDDLDDQHEIDDVIITMT